MNSDQPPQAFFRCPVGVQEGRNTNDLPGSLPMRPIPSDNRLSARGIVR